MTATIETRWFGGIRVDALLDGELRFPLARMFGAGAAPWPKTELPIRFPEEFDGDQWRFRVRVFLVRSADKVVLVDCGIGPAARPMAVEFGQSGRLPELLAEVGLATSQVTDVVLTHAHDDHVGWVTTEQGDLTFPAARHHLAGLDLASGLTTTYGELYRAVADRSRFDGVAMGTIAPGVELVDTRGHTPGHRSVRVDGTVDRLWITGDLVHLTFQLEQPEADGPFDADPAAGRAARAVWCQQWRPGDVIGSAHLPQPFTPLPTRVTASADRRR